MSAKSKIIVLLSCVAMPASLWPTLGYAQDSQPQNEAGRSNTDIIVTARRTEERLQDVPISISVLTPEQLNDRNITGPNDLGTYVPSLSSNPRFGLQNAFFAIRGFTQEGGTSPSVAIYFADVVAPRGQGATPGGNGGGPGSFFDLQNVQVLKGPQGTLFGRNTTGGAILLQPVKPTSRLEGYVEGTYGNFDQKRLQGVLNIPISESIRLRFGADYNNRDGYIHNKTAIGPRDFGNIDYIAARASLVMDLTPDLENYTVVSYTHSKDHGFPIKLTLCGTDVPGYVPGFVDSITGPIGCAQIARQNARGDGYWDVENGVPDSGQNTRQWQAINTTTWKASDFITAKAILSYAELKQSQSLSIFGQASSDPAFTNVFPSKGFDNISQSTMTAELQLQGTTPDDKLQWQGGVYYERARPLGFQSNTAAVLVTCSDPSTYQCYDYFIKNFAFPFPIGSLQETYAKHNFRNLGIYGQATYKFNKQFSLTAGLRYTSDRTWGIGRVLSRRFLQPNVPTTFCAIQGTLVTSDPSICDVTAEEKSKKPTWLIDVDYKPTDDILLYAKYARGYRQGSINVSNASFRTWQPEKVDTYEIGAKFTFRGPISGNFNIAAFYNDFTNQQLQSTAIGIPPTPAAAPIINAGTSRIKGIEVDTSITPLDNLTFDISYAYLDTKLLSFTPPLFDTTKYSAVLPSSGVGGPLSLAPKNRITLTGTYRLPIDEALGKLALSATFTHTDKQVANSTTPIGILPPTDLLNLNVNWSGIGGTPIDASFFMTNVTNEKYPVYVSGSFVASGYDGILLGAPRMFGVRLRYSFGR